MQKKASPAAQKVAVESLAKISQHAAEVDISSSDAIQNIFNNYLDFKRESLRNSESLHEREQINKSADQAFNKATESILEINIRNKYFLQGLTLTIASITLATATAAIIYYKEKDNKNI